MSYFEDWDHISDPCPKCGRTTLYYIQDHNGDPHISCTTCGNVTDDFLDEEAYPPEEREQ